MNLWSSLFGNGNKKSARGQLSLDQWAEYYKYNGNQYPILGGSYGTGSKSEQAPNDFSGYVNQLYKANGVVFAVCMARMLAFSEARLVFQKLEEGRGGDFVHRKELELLETPWPNGTTAELLARAIQDVDMAGNHYVVREDGINGPRLRRLRPDWVDIVLTADPQYATAVDVAGYVYKPGGSEDSETWKIYPIDGSNGVVAHWCPLPDPDALYRGMSWLTPVLAEVISDKAITRHKQKFFENGATLGHVVSVDSSVSAEEFEKFQRLFRESKRGVENAYETLFLGGGADVKVVGTNLQQLDFSSVTAQGELRIASAGRVPASMVGLTGGLSGASLNEGNFEASRNSFADGTLRPMWRSLCTAYAPLVHVPRRTRLWFDDRDIALLREDQTKVAMLQQIQTTTLTRLVMNGFTWKSSVEFLRTRDFRVLEHTGLYSVQLLPPEISNPDGADDEGDPESNSDGDNKPDDEDPDADSKLGDKKRKPSKANNFPTGSKRKPVGRPPKDKRDNSESEPLDDPESAWLDAVRRGADWDDEAQWGDTTQ